MSLVIIVIGVLAQQEHIDPFIGSEVQGTTPQPTWQSVQVTVVNVTENVNGTGTD